MISAELLGRLRCPVCLEEEGCAACRRGGDHAIRCAPYRERVGCACGGPDKLPLAPAGDALRCGCCGARYPVHAEGGYVDLVPRTTVGEVTRYADEEFHDRLQVIDAPPVLSAGVKADLMRRLLRPDQGDLVLDLGCGAGKMALYVAGHGARAAGVDVAPFFLPRAAAGVELVLGDLRRLPFGKGAYPRAFSLDVLEHLDETGVGEVLREARRTVGEGGRLVVYTHAMESSRLAAFQRAVNRLAARLGRRGLIDHQREALRKSDHVNAIRSHEHFDVLCAGAGFEVAQRRYYNVVLKAVVEDLLLRLWEQRRRQRAAPAAAREAHPPLTSSPAAAGALHHHHHHHAAGPRPHGSAALLLARALTWVLKLDVVLFGGVRTGPFFGLLLPKAPGPRA